VSIGILSFLPSPFCQDSVATYLSLPLDLYFSGPPTDLTSGSRGAGCFCSASHDADEYFPRPLTVSGETCSTLTLFLRHVASIIELARFLSPSFLFLSR